MAAKPIVDGIERKHGDQLRVIRLNIQDPVGAALLDQFDFRATPTFIFFSPEGEEVQRWVGAILSEEVDQLMEDLSAVEA